MRLPQPRRVDVFAVEDRSAQVCWSGLPRPEMTLEVGDQELLVGAPAPGWYRPAGLRGWLSAAPGPRPGRRQPGPGPARGETGGGGHRQAGWSPPRPYRRQVPARMVRSVPVRSRSAAWNRRRPTTSCSAGRAGPASGWPPSPRCRPRPGGSSAGSRPSATATSASRPSAPLRRFRDPDPRPPDLAPYPVRCARVAIAEAEAWGAELLVAKGDLTYEGEVDGDSRTRRRSCWRRLGAGRGDPGQSRRPRLGRRRRRSSSACGLLPTLRPRARDLPGVRLVLGHSPLPDRHSGAITATDVRDLARLAGEAAGPVVVALHHPPSRWPVQTHYPPSIVWRDTTRLVDELAAANPATLILAGHTHRNRRYPVRRPDRGRGGQHQGLPGRVGRLLRSTREASVRSCTGSPSPPPSPGPSSTRRALGGIWGRWSPGRLSDRCWTLEWPQVP